MDNSVNSSVSKHIERDSEGNQKVFAITETKGEGLPRELEIASRLISLDKLTVAGNAQVERVFDIVDRLIAEYNRRYKDD